MAWNRDDSSPALSPPQRASSTREMIRFAQIDPEPSRLPVGQLASMIPVRAADPQGLYGEICAAALLSRCREDLLTGRLLFRRNAIQKEFRLWQGWVISARSNVHSETLSNLLLSWGEIKAFQHRRVLEEMSRQNQRQGRLLVKMGVLSEQGVTLNPSARDH